MTLIARRGYRLHLIIIVEVVGMYIILLAVESPLVGATLYARESHMTTTYTPNTQGTRVIAYVHYDDGSTRAITLPRVYDTARAALLACVVLVMADQTAEQARSDELARLGK